MGKSSSSSKKIKRSKDSSKLRSVKKKKKTKRSKSKKIRLIRDYSDENELSASDSDYRRRKRRSKVSKKKRSRKRYSSSESDDDDDTRLLKNEKRSKRKDNHVGKRNKKKSISRKRRKRDLSSSHTSSHDSQPVRPGEDSEPDDCCQEEDEVVTKNNPTRLKSIIVVSYNYDNDERKDDHDVYLTHSHSGSIELTDTEESDERDGQTTISHPRTAADASGHEYVEDCKSATATSLKDDDLEAILKKRALENLKRFRGRARKEDSSSARGEHLQTETELGEEQKLCVSPTSKDFETSQKIVQVVNAKDSDTSFPNLASQQDQLSGDTTKVKSSSGISSCTTKRKLIRPVLGQETLNLASRKEATGCHDAEAEIINGRTTEAISPESSLAWATQNGGKYIEPEPIKISSTLEAQSSSQADTGTLDETKGESQSEQKTVDGTKDESQYEQKTMTVMRGGELVQVNYKVYIPKKASSLGRRQLKR